MAGTLRITAMQAVAFSGSGLVPTPPFRSSDSVGSDDTPSTIVSLANEFWRLKADGAAMVVAIDLPATLDATGSAVIKLDIGETEYVYLGTAGMQAAKVDE